MWNGSDETRCLGILASEQGAEISHTVPCRLLKGQESRGMPDPHSPPDLSLTPEERYSFLYPLSFCAVRTVGNFCLHPEDPLLEGKSKVLCCLGHRVLRIHRAEEEWLSDEVRIVSHDTFVISLLCFYVSEIIS